MHGYEFSRNRLCISWSDIMLSIFYSLEWLWQWLYGLQSRLSWQLQDELWIFSLEWKQWLVVRMDQNSCEKRLSCLSKILQREDGFFKHDICMTAWEFIVKRTLCDTSRSWMGSHLTHGSVILRGKKTRTEKVVRDTGMRRASRSCW